MKLSFATCPRKIPSLQVSTTVCVRLFHILESSLRLSLVVRKNTKGTDKLGSREKHLAQMRRLHIRVGVWQTSLTGNKTPLPSPAQTGRR